MLLLVGMGEEGYDHIPWAEMFLTTSTVCTLWYETICMTFNPYKGGIFLRGAAACVSKKVQNS